MFLKLPTTEKRTQKLPLLLIPGLIVPIWIVRNDGSYYYETDAVLVEKINNWREPLPYPFVEFGDKKVVNAVKELWKVKIVNSSVFDNGRELVRFIPRYHSLGYLHFSENEENYLDIELDDKNLIE